MAATHKMIRGHSGGDAMIKKTLLVLVVSLFGCVTPTRYAWRANPITGPDGTRNWAIVTCVDSKANCFEAASQTCHGGRYNIEDTTDHSSTSSMGHFSSWGTSAWGFARQDTHLKLEMLVHCLPSEE